MTDKSSSKSAEATFGVEDSPGPRVSDEDRARSLKDGARSDKVWFRAIPVLLALSVLGTQAYLAIGRNFANVLETPFLPYCLLGAFSIHMATRPGRKERLWTLIIAAIAIVGFVAFGGKFRPTWSNIIACGAFLGLASLTVLAVQVLRLRGAGQTCKLHTLFAGSVFGFSALFIAAILNLTTKLHPQTYDLYLYAADQGYGIPISAWVAQFLSHHAKLSWICGFVYESLPLAVSLLYAYQRSGAKPLGIRVLPAFIGGGAAVYVLYNILPAAGPYYAFGPAFPNHLPHSAGLHTIPLGEVARNAIPSMHLACALLIFWNCRRLPRWVYGGAAIYLALTVLSALGLGEHYVIDLVAAVPYVLLLQAVCAPGMLRSRPEWKQSMAVGAAFSIAWIAAARFGTPLFHSVVFTWAASIFTLVLCAAARYRMLGAESALKPDRDSAV
jgi:hypothetical protein